MIEKTVLIIEDGHQITFDGHPKIEDLIGINVIKEIEEVVDDMLVHCYTINSIAEGLQGSILNVHNT